MRQLLSLINKEFMLMRRDIHGMGLLFVMPAVFMLIMTFALKNQYAISQDNPVHYYLVNEQAGEKKQSVAVKALIEGMDEQAHFQRLGNTVSLDEAATATARDDVQFSLIVNADFDRRLSEHQPALELLFSPGVSPAFSELIRVQVGGLLKKIYVEENYGDYLQEQDFTLLTGPNDVLLTHRYLYRQQNLRPSSVQQNVPAWLLFAMFFIAIPLSTTLIKEREQGTLRRLHSMGLSPVYLVAGKFLPYFLINLLQVFVLFLVGLYLIPALGGERLNLGAHPEALLLIALAASFAAVSFGLFVAQLASTVEQATIFSALCNIIMAAIGGIMVPRFIMPAGMQAASDFSPMSWGLQGFLDVLLRDGGMTDVLPEAVALMGFAVLLLVLAALHSRWFLRPY
ncbi:MAG: ABC transporter permease [Parahaliea sp.]